MSPNMCNLCPRSIHSQGEGMRPESAHHRAYDHGHDYGTIGANPPSPGWRGMEIDNDPTTGGVRVIKASEFKAKCLQLMDEVAASGEDDRDHQASAARSRELGPYQERPKSLFGTGRKVGDSVAPLDEEWEAAIETVKGARYRQLWLRKVRALRHACRTCDRRGLAGVGSVSPRSPMGSSAARD